jgi:hypothetical protein
MEIRIGKPLKASRRPANVKLTRGENAATVGVVIGAELLKAR